MIYDVLGIDACHIQMNQFALGSEGIVISESFRSSIFIKLSVIFLIFSFLLNTIIFCTYHFLVLPFTVVYFLPDFFLYV